MQSFVTRLAHWMRNAITTQDHVAKAVGGKRLSFEQLESRVLMSAKLSDLLGASVEAPPLNDRFEENDSFGAAVNLGVVASTKSVTLLTVNDDDWYRFRIARTGGSGDYVRINFVDSRGDLDLQLYNSSGGLLSTSSGVTNVEQISLNGRAAGQYYVRVYGFSGATNPNYSMYIDAPYVADDAFENNDTMATARNLGTLTNPVQYADRVSLDDDWFKFTTTRTGTQASFVQIGFSHAQGDLDLVLYNSAGTQVGSSAGVVNYEFVSLNGLPAGTYFAKVNGFGGVTNRSYDLSIAAPNVKNSEHTLYVNFDGAFLSRADLDDWADNGGNGLNPGDWLFGLSDPTNGLDDDNNGINVNAFLAGTASRETIISLMLSYLRTDLAPFGIQAVRHFGLAVEDQEATTIFLGPSTLTNGNFHVACDIDVGNVNSTDIAFVGDEGLNIWGTAGRVAITMADVALHEAGHTFGLYHVLTGNTLESMGRRYNTPQSSWVANTAFLNQTFSIFPGHGPSGTQNSFQYMRSVFGGPTSDPSADVLGSVDWAALGGPSEANAASLLSVAHVQSAEPTLARLSPFESFSPSMFEPQWAAVTTQTSIAGVGAPRAGSSARLL